MVRILLTLFIAIISVGCGGPRYVDYFPYHDDGRCKPCVAMLPVVDCAKACLPWDISEELSMGMRYRFMDNAEIFLMNPKKVDAICSNLNSVDFFGRDNSFSQQFCDSEFVVVTEFIEHKVVPYKMGTIDPLYTLRSGKCLSVLMMKVRLKIIDIRGDQPCVIWQEIVQSNHMIPRDGECVNYEKTPWKSQAYCRTPLGMAHQRLICDIVQRIESVTCKAR